MHWNNKSKSVAFLLAFIFGVWFFEPWMFPFLLTLVLAKEAGTKIVSGDWDSKIEDIFEISHEVNTFFVVATTLITITVFIAPILMG